MTHLSPDTFQLFIHSFEEPVRESVHDLIRTCTTFHAAGSVQDALEPEE